MWALGKHAIKGRGASLPDVLARAERDLPSGFFTLASLERFIRLGLASRGRGNAFGELGRTLLIPAVDINTAERVVFGAGQLASVPISDAVAASSAIPGFFDPYGIDGRDYVDGGVGFCGHADLAAAAGADVVFVVNPLVPNRQNNGHSIGSRGVYTIMFGVAASSDSVVSRYEMSTCWPRPVRSRANRASAMPSAPCRLAPA